MGAGIALTLGGLLSFLLNLVGFLPVLIRKVDPIVGTQLKDSLLSLAANIPQEQAAGFFVTIVAAIPTTWLLGFAVWVMMTLLIAGFISVMKGLKGILVGGVIAAVAILYLTGQLGALIPQP